MQKSVREAITKRVIRNLYNDHVYAIKISDALLDRNILYNRLDAQLLENFCLCLIGVKCGIFIMVHFPNLVLLFVNNGSRTILWDALTELKMLLATMIVRL